MSQESLKFAVAHFLGMAFIVEEDIFSDPVNAGLFGIAGVMLDWDGVTHLVEEFYGTAFHGFAPDNCMQYRTAVLLSHDKL